MKDGRAGQPSSKLQWWLLVVVFVSYTATFSVAQPTVPDEAARVRQAIATAVASLQRPPAAEPRQPAQDVPTKVPPLRPAATQSAASQHTETPASEVPNAAPTAAPRNPLLPAPAVSTTTAARSIVRAQGTKFVDDDCREFLYTGWNTYNELMLAGTTVPPPSSLQLAAGLLAGRDDTVTQRFRDANAAGMRVFRMFATGGDYSGFVLQPEPGRYNETVFRALDYVVAQAGRYGLKVVLSILDNWQVADNKGAFVKWAGVSDDDFWTAPAARTLYKNHVRALTSRINVFTGVPYAQDPAIFSWNLYNELRDPANQNGPGQPGPATAWINEMAAFIKTLDPNHMVTVGEEGFFAAGSPFVRWNPYGTPGNVKPGWSQNVGQDFVAQHLSPNIDYAAIHLWPDNWNTTEVRFVPLWIEGHQLATEQVLKKPLVLEEFGKVAAVDAAGQVVADDPAFVASNIAEVRDPYYEATYNLVENSLAKGRPLRAVLFWEWAFPGNQRGDRGVDSADSTFKMITAHARKLEALPRPVLPGCVPKGAPVVSDSAAAPPV